MKKTQTDPQKRIDQLNKTKTRDDIYLSLVYMALVLLWVYEPLYSTEIRHLPGVVSVSGFYWWISYRNGGRHAAALFRKKPTQGIIYPLYVLLGDCLILGNLSIYYMGSDRLGPVLITLFSIYVVGYMFRYGGANTERGYFPS